MNLTWIQIEYCLNLTSGVCDSFYHSLSDCENMSNKVSFHHLNDNSFSGILCCTASQTIPSKLFMVHSNSTALLIDVNARCILIFERKKKNKVEKVIFSVLFIRLNVNAPWHYHMEPIILAMMSKLLCFNRTWNMYCSEHCKSLIFFMPMRNECNRNAIPNCNLAWSFSRSLSLYRRSITICLYEAKAPCSISNYKHRYHVIAVVLLYKHIFIMLTSN